MAKRTVEVLIKAKDQTKKAVESSGKGFKGLQKTLTDNAALIARFGGAAVAAMGAATAAVYKFLDSTASMEDALAKAAKRAQVDIETYGEWAHVLQLSGASAGDFEKIIAVLSRQMLNAKRGSKEAVDGFADLGISVTTSDGQLKDAATTFDEVVSSLSSMEDSTQRAALAQVLLGRGGKQLIPVLDQTTDQIKAQRDEWHRLGGDAIASAAETGEAWVDAKRRISTANDGIRASFLEAFGPAIIAGLDRTAESVAVIGDNLDLIDSSKAIANINDFFDVVDRSIPATSAFASLTAAIANIQVGNLGAAEKNLLEFTETWIKADKAASESALASKGLKLSLPGSSDDITQLKEFNDLMKLTREELESVASARGISPTHQMPEILPGYDIPKTSEDLANAIVESYKAAVVKAQAAIEASPDTKISIAAELEGGEALANNLQGAIVYYEDIIAAQESVKQGADQWLEKVATLKEQVSQLWGIYQGLTFQSDSGAADLTDNLEGAAIAANGLGNGLASLAVDAPFKAMSNDAVDFAKVMQTTVVGVLQSVLKQLLVIRAVGFFGQAFGLKDGGTIPGNLGQAPALSAGGSIPKAAFGYSVPDGIRGQDSRVIYAMPGEEVINRQLSQRLNRFITAQESSAYASPYGSGLAGVGGGGTVVMNVGIPDSMAGLQRMKDGIIERLSEGGEA